MNLTTLREVNQILATLNSTSLIPQKALQETTLPPAGYLTFFCLLHSQYGCFPYEEIRELDLLNITGEEILEMIDGA